MLPDRAATTSSVIDVLDHVIDKGIVVDAWARVSATAIDLLSFEHLVVASDATVSHEKETKKR